jgi:hypothetical protein
MKNRILQAIETYKEAATKKGLTASGSAELSKKLDMEFSEYCHFQNLKSVKMGSVLSPDEAQTIYCFLGNTPEHFNKQPVEVKAVLTQVFFELMKR